MTATGTRAKDAAPSETNSLPLMQREYIEMSLQDILVVLDGSAQSDIRLTAAIALAQKHEAFLTCCCALDLLHTIRTGTWAGGNNGAETGVAEVAEGIETNVRNRIRFAGLQGDWVVIDKVNEAFTRRLRHADLIVLGQADPDHPLAVRNLVEDVLLTAGRPVLVIPYAGHFETIGDNILVGWNGSREAARAVNDAIPLMLKARSVTIFEAYPIARKSEHDNAADVASHLARHGVNAHTAHTVMAGISAPDALLSYAADIGVDLLVVGGYGHSRLRELILGGVTRGLLQHLTLPMLMSH
jgi:nucleotide-binding universal stress UspA family protein